MAELWHWEIILGGINTDWAACEENRNVWLSPCSASGHLFLLLLKDQIFFFFPWPFFSEYFCWDAFVFEVLLDESSYLQTFFFSVHSGNGMTKNTPTLIPGSWDYFFPFSYFLTPLISITSLAVLWWWQARLLPSAALLFPLHVSVTLKEADAPATSKENSQGLMLFDKMDASSLYFGIDIRCQNRFFKWFLFVTLYQIFSSILEMCGLMLRFKSLSVEKSV